jgi:hypothetical protein
MSVKLLLEDGNTCLGRRRHRIEQTDTGTQPSSVLEIYLVLQNWNEDQSRTVPQSFAREQEQTPRDLVSCASALEQSPGQTTRVSEL